MGNGTHRFNQIEAYICSLPKHQQEYAIGYYHYLLNKRKRLEGMTSGPITQEIADKIDTIMYKI